MPTQLDPSLIGGRVQPLKIGDLFKDREAIATSRQQQAARQIEMDNAQAKTVRTNDARKALSDLVLAGPAPKGVPAGSRPLSMIGRPDAQPQAQAPSGDAMSSAWERYARADPGGAIDYSKHLASLDKSQFEMTQHLSNEGFKIIAGVHDQASYDQAKQRAVALYGQYGMNLEHLNLPDQYTPELGRDLQMQAMNTHSQVEVAARQKKLEWDEEDDRLDNSRADRNTDSLITDRTSREARTGRNTDSMIADRAGRRTETRRYHDQPRPTRQTAGGRSPDLTRPTARPTATGPNGEKVEYDGKAWVPIK